MPLSPREMEAAIINNLSSKTGKGLDEWVAFVRENGPTGKKERLDWLKTTHRLGHVQASIILGRLETGKSDYADENSLVDGLFQDENASARPLYEFLKRKILALGNDVKMEPDRTYLSFQRKRQFLVIRPVRGVLIVGLALPEDFKNERLAKARHLGTPARINYQVSVREQGDVDSEFIWLVRQAYEGK